MGVAETRGGKDRRDFRKYDFLQAPVFLSGSEHACAVSAITDFSEVSRDFAGSQMAACLKPDRKTEINNGCLIDSYEHACY